MNRVFIFLLLLGFACVRSPLFAQVRVAETDVNLQKKLIEANREKLLGNYDKALAILEELRKQKKDEDALLYEMARIHAASESIEKSIPLLRQAIALSPGNQWYRETLALYLEELGQFSGAAGVYGELSADFPREKDYYFNQAFLLVQADEIDDAIKVYDAWEKIVGLQPESTLNKYRLYAGTGNEKKAIKELESLISAYPSNTDYRHLLADHLLDTGDEKAALQVYEEILQTDPYDSKAQVALATAEQTKNAAKTDDPTTALIPLFEQESINIDVKIAKILPDIQKLAESGDKALAAGLLKLTTILEQVHPNDAKAFAASGDLYFLTDQFKMARERYEKTLSLDDSRFMVWENLFYVMQAQEDWEALRMKTELAMDYFPNKGSVYLFNGIASAELSAWDDALDVLEQAELIFSLDKPGLLQVLLLKGKVIQGMGNVAEAETVFQEALGIAPENPMALHDYAMFFYRRENYSEALNRMEKALEAGGNKTALILEHCGDIWYRLDKPEKALEYWSAAQKLGTGGSKWLSKKIADKKLYE